MLAGMPLPHYACLAHFERLPQYVRLARLE